MKIEKYNNIAIILHWLIAIIIILQLGCGLWMTDAIKNEETRKVAYEFYKYHKSFGLLILILSLTRLIWRFYHKPPQMPKNMTKIEIFLANSTHIILYFLIIAIPFSGWLMTSSSSFGIATMFFGLFEWPQISFIAELSNKEELNKIFNISHALISRLLIFLLILHILAALKHQFINKDKLINRILP